MITLRNIKWGWMGSILGSVILLAYLNAAFGWVDLSRRLALVLGFALGPAGIIGTLGLTKALSARHSKEELHFGSVFLIAAFSILTLMLTIQQALFAKYDQLKLVAGPGDISALKQAFALANQVQQGADVAFDIFYCTGLFVISKALLSVSGFPRALGVYGIVSSVSLLALNIWTFPIAPKYAGAVDLGPATILWWVGLVILARRRVEQTPHAV